MPYASTKTYGHEIGLSCCFRQWRAKSHCSKLHGYALSFTFTFAAETLDQNNWVVDFGSLKELRKDLEERFDHKTIVASDDPKLNWYYDIMGAGIADIVVLDRVGCEAFAEYAAWLAHCWLTKYHPDGRVSLVSVEVKEHGANSAIYITE